MFTQCPHPVTHKVIFKKRKRKTSTKEHGEGRRGNKTSTCLYKKNGEKLNAVKVAGMRGPGDLGVIDGVAAPICIGRGRKLTETPDDTEPRAEGPLKGEVCIDF